MCTYDSDVRVLIPAGTVPTRLLLDRISDLDEATHATGWLSTMTVVAERVQLIGPPTTVW